MIHTSNYNIEVSLMGSNELMWLSKHRKEVEKYSGKWIAIEAKKGILAWGETVKEVIEAARKKHKVQSPTIFLVPRKDEEAYIL